MSGPTDGPSAARSRIDLLLDPGSFLELDALASCGVDGVAVLTGIGTIDDRPVCVFGHDATLSDAAGSEATGSETTRFAGGTGEVAGAKIVKLIDVALKTGCPLISIYAGARAENDPQEGGGSLGRYAEIFRRSSHASGVIPQLSLVLGELTGALALAPALSDFVVLVERQSQLVVNGPEVLASVTGEEVSREELGGGRMHATMSGSAHYLAADETDAIGYLQDLLSYLPQNNLEDPPVHDVVGGPQPGEVPTEEDLILDTLIPGAPNLPYDMHEVLNRVLDDGEFCEVQELYAPNIVVGYGRIDGRSVGVVANQPLHFAGCLDIKAAGKAARFIRTCDAFNTPVISFVDVPGFLPGTDQDRGDIVRRGAKLAYAYAEATVPLVTVITRQAHGHAHAVMGSKQLGADVTLAWPASESATAVAGRGQMDAVIKPHETRSEITRALRLLRTKRASLPPKKHGNIPL